MKILLISSGYKGIYDWFEGCIINVLRKNHEVRLFHPFKGLANLRQLTQMFQPNLVLTLVGFKLPRPMLQWIKQQQNKLAVWFTEDPYYMDRTANLFKDYDYVFSIDSAAVDFYKNHGKPHVYQLSLATAPEVFFPKPVQAKYQSEICIVGYPYPERVREVQLLLQKTSYKIQVVGKWTNTLYKFRQHPNLKIHEGWADPATVANFYNGAKIVLNTHRPYDLKQNMNKFKIKGRSINNRTFDVAACEAFQLVDYRDDLNSHFIEGEEMASFHDFNQLMDQVDYYLKSEAERKEMARKARERVLKEHTFEKRIEHLTSIISKEME